MVHMDIEARMLIGSDMGPYSSVIQDLAARQKVAYSAQKSTVIHLGLVTK